MPCHLTFFAVGNADCTLVRVEGGPAMVVDMTNVGLLLERFQEHGISSLSRVYITHDHNDHFPGLIKFVRFLERWLSEGGETLALCPPRDLVMAARRRLKDLSDKGKTASPTYKQLQAALDRLQTWNDSGRLEIYSMEADLPSWREGGLEVRVLHPSYFFLENRDPSTLPSKNEASVVLRIQYGTFAVVLLADLDGTGISAMLRRASNRPSELKCNMVKVPHHGAWPRNGDELVDLIRHMNPELAVLSVGSTNSYQHVRPELFDALVKLRGDMSTSLRAFICTEATRTCMRSVEERAQMESRGLSEKRLCAGDIEVEVQSDGQWHWSGEKAHREELPYIPYAACQAGSSPVARRLAVIRTKTP